jgi:hypothetical protein
MSVDLRPFRSEDALRVADLYNRASQALYGENTTSTDQFDVWLTTPGWTSAETFGRRDRTMFSSATPMSSTRTRGTPGSGPTSSSTRIAIPTRVGRSQTGARPRAREDARDGASLRVWVADQSARLQTVLEESGEVDEKNASPITGST